MKEDNYFCANLPCINHVKVKEGTKTLNVLYPDGRVHVIGRETYRTSFGKEYTFCSSCARMANLVNQLEHID